MGAFLQWGFDSSLLQIGSNHAGSEVSISSGVNSEAIRIDSNQNVGIGTTTPNEGLTLEGGVMSIKETTTPTATTNYGKVYTKTDNELYFQDGA